MDSHSEQSGTDVHVYRFSMRRTAIVVGLIGVAIGFYVLVTLLDGSHGTQRSDVLFGLCFMFFWMAAGAAMIRVALTQRIVLSPNSLLIENGFTTHIIPFSEIRGWRSAGGRGFSGIYLYRLNGPRIFINESNLKLDDYYKAWRGSLSNLDRADYEERKARGKATPIDWIRYGD